MTFKNTVKCDMFTLQKPCLLAFVFVCLLSGCSGGNEPDQRNKLETLFQVSTLQALLDGHFEGLMTYGKVLTHGDFGLGTFDGLDGEMIALDGEVYQVKADGIAYPVDGEITTPFAAMTFFDADISISHGQSMDLMQIEATIDSMLTTTSIPYAIKVEGVFDSITTRSVARQGKPYPGLAEALAGQVEFTLEEIEGTMVGFRLPVYMDGANVAGYHFHFISADRSAGGHVLSCQTRTVQIGIDDIGNWSVIFGAQ